MAGTKPFGPRSLLCDIVYLVSVHCHLVYAQILQVCMHFAVICLTDEKVSCLLCLQLGLMLARTAYTAAYTGHTLYKVCRKLADLHKKQRFLTLCRTVALHYVRGDILVHLLEALYHRCGYAACVTETLAEYRTFLIGVLLRLKLFARIMARISPKVMA